MTPHEQEDVIRRWDHEWAFVWNGEGLLVLAKEGGRNEVEFSEEEVLLMRGAVLTRNHPHGLSFPDVDPRSFGHSFSEDDIHLACSAGMAEMRVVTPKLRFSMKPPVTGWSQKLWDADIHPSYVKHYDQVWEELMDAFSSGAISSAEADARIAHETWSRVANEIGLLYVREEG